MRYDLSLATVLFGTTIAIVQPAIAANQLSSEQISNIAEEITVQIFLVRDGKREKAGSGVVAGFNRAQSEYYILTSRHVMEYAGDYQVKMPDGFYGLSPVSSRELADLGLEILPQLDVTVLKFRSLHNYPSAQLNYTSQLTNGQNVYVFGYPSILPVDRYFTQGYVTSINANETHGYDFAYTNEVVPGTSGGPVLSQAGQVIGINGKAERDPVTGRLIGFGIPLSRFMTKPLPLAPLVSEFPKASCGDRNPGGSHTWHPVLVDYSEATLRRIQTDYCRDAMRKDNTIQVASFLSVEKAQDFASFMQNAVGSGRLGSAYLPSQVSPRRTWNFPMATCGDRDPGGRNTWYPVFVNYSEARLRMIHAQYCRDAIRNYREKLKLHSIQIASFLNQEDAQAFADLMKDKLGSGEVGESSQFDGRSATSGATRR